MPTDAESVRLLNLERAVQTNRAVKFRIFYKYLVGIFCRGVGNFCRRYAALGEVLRGKKEKQSSGMSRKRSRCGTAVDGRRRGRRGPQNERRTQRSAAGACDSLPFFSQHFIAVDEHHWEKFAESDLKKLAHFFCG
jgi:hypothetical protein